jgi:hypothetical protein
MGIALAGVAGIAALVVVVVAGRGGGSLPAPAFTPGGQRFQAAASLSPRSALFGDTITAWIDLTFDHSRFDPANVRITTSFAPWTAIGGPKIAREDAGSTTFMRTTYTLRCLVAICVPSHELTRYDFKPARILYVTPVGESTNRVSIAAQWPELVLHSRLDGSTNAQRDPLAAPWRADIVSLPAVTYRVSPGRLAAGLVGLGSLFLALAGVIVYRARPRRGPPPPPPPPPPAPRLAPLEQALLLLETTATADGVEERRRSLELVADELATLEEHDLERGARQLAWSEEDPEPEATRALAATVRAYVEERSNGDVA